MTQFEVVFRPDAEADLFFLYHRIAKAASIAGAGAYIGRIEATCLTLETFPERGTRRDDLGPGVRTMGLERRATILFTVGRVDVAILRVFHGGQDCEWIPRQNRGLSSTPVDAARGS